MDANHTVLQHQEREPSCYVRESSWPRQARHLARAQLIVPWMISALRIMLAQTGPLTASKLRLNMARVELFSNCSMSSPSCKFQLRVKTQGGLILQDDVTFADIVDGFLSSFCLFCTLDFHALLTDGGGSWNVSI